VNREVDRAGSIEAGRFPVLAEQHHPEHGAPGLQRDPEACLAEHLRGGGEDGAEIVEERFVEIGVLRAIDVGFDVDPGRRRCADRPPRRAFAPGPRSGPGGWGRLRPHRDWARSGPGVQDHWRPHRRPKCLLELGDRAIPAVRLLLEAAQDDRVDGR
jgi:hypothetical protein